jgi:hypothetical protein
MSTYLTNYGTIPPLETNLVLNQLSSVHTPCGHHFVKQTAIKFFGEMTATKCEKPRPCPYCNAKVEKYEEDSEPYFVATNLTKSAQSAQSLPKYKHPLDCDCVVSNQCLFASCAVLSCTVVLYWMASVV